MDFVLSPFKGKDLTWLERAFNSSVNSGRVIVENAFSRMKQLFNFFHIRFRGREDDLTRMVTICAHLTNVDILIRPLRAK